MRVLVVDDHSIARGGLIQLLRSAFRDPECTEVESGAAALDAAGTRPPDLILMDMQLAENPQGHVLCSQLRGIAPAAPIVVVTAFDDVAEIKRCLAAGADGVVLKGTSSEGISDALKRVLRGETVISSRISDLLAKDMVGVVRGDGVVRLTTREREVLNLLAQGCTNRAIGEQLHVSESTVKEHVSGLLKKLETTARLQAVLRASELGLI